METEEQVVCLICEIELAEDDIVTSASGDKLCNDCIRVCDRCDGVGSVDDEYHGVSGSTWCDPCTDSYANFCDREEAYVEGDTHRIDDRGEKWCSDCADNEASWCDNCGHYTVDSCCDDDDYDASAGGVIHDYSYLVAPIFHSTDDSSRLFFGMEVEMEAPHSDDRREAAHYAQHKLEEETDLAYLKNDGSLNCGFEVVTHPMTYDFFMNEAPEFWETIDKLKTDYGMKSWDTKTCGLHIHISRTGFNGPAHTHRFINLVYSNQEFYELMAGRANSSWSKFDDVAKWDDKKNKWVRSYAHKIADPELMNTDRYSAINTNNRATLEMRIFRGSINTTNIRGALGLAHASVEYTRTMSLQRVKDGSLRMENLIDYINSKPDLYADVITRMGRIEIPLSNLLYNRENLSI